MKQSMIDKTRAALEAADVLVRRIAAFILDFILASIFSFAMWFAVAFITLGLIFLDNGEGPGVKPRTKGPT
jgi:hypothetical protein